jgi:hypothetical protein
MYFCTVEACATSALSSQGVHRRDRRRDRDGLLHERIGGVRRRARRDVETLNNAGVMKLVTGKFSVCRLPDAISN